MISETREREGEKRKSTGVETHVNAHDDAVGHLAIHLRGDEHGDVSCESAQTRGKEEPTIREEREEHEEELGRGQKIVAVLHSVENAHGLVRFGEKRLVIVGFGEFGEFGERRRQETKQNRAQKHEEGEG